MAKKTKIPKRFIGVKLPKPLRRALKDLARSQNGRTLLAEAVVAAGGVLATYEARRGSRTRAILAEKAPRAKAKARKVAAEARSWTGAGGAFEDAARAFTESLKRRAQPEPAASPSSPPTTPAGTAN